MKKAFTLIEILVIMAILGVAVIMVVPAMGERAVQGDEQEAFFKDLLTEHYNIAQKEGVPIKIVGFKGSANMEKYDGTRISIPKAKSVQSARINGEATPGLEYHITIYPDGICDHFMLDLDDKLRIESLPLLMVVKRERL